MYLKHKIIIQLKQPMKKNISKIKKEILVFLYRGINLFIKLYFEIFSKNNFCSVIYNTIQYISIFIKLSILKTANTNIEQINNK